MVTELLAQRLASRYRRAYLDKYRHQTFVAFATGHLSAEIPLLPGLVALAARFVERATGQATGLMELGVVRVA